MPKITWNKTTAQKAQEKQAAALENLIRISMAKLCIKTVGELAGLANLSKHTLWNRMSKGNTGYGKWTISELMAVAQVLRWSGDECAAALGRQIA